MKPGSDRSALSPADRVWLTLGAQHAVAASLMMAWRRKLSGFGGARDHGPRKMHSDADDVRTLLKCYDVVDSVFTLDGRA